MKELKVYGKGVYIWYARNVFGGNIPRIVEEFKAAGVRVVTIKINNGIFVWKGSEALFDALRKAGIFVGGWGYVYIKNFPEWEARIAVEACQLYKPDFYLIDAEGEATNQWPNATLFTNRFVDGLADAGLNIPVALNGYWKPTYHEDYPYDAFRRRCDFDCPQMYWRGSNPVGKLQASIAEHARLLPHLPYSMVAGDMYYEGGIKPAPGQITDFLTACQENSQIQAVVMWAADQNETQPDLWREFSAFQWTKDSDKFPEQDDTPPVVIVPEKLPGKYKVLAYRLNVFIEPGQDRWAAEPLQEGAEVDATEFRYTNRGELFAHITAPAGWIRAEYIENAFPISELSGEYVVTSDTLKVFTGPSSLFKQSRQSPIRAGKHVMLLETRISRGEVFVRIADPPGWVRSAFLSKV